MIGYTNEIFCLQEIHFPLKNNHDNNGTLQYQETVFPQDEQYERFCKIGLSYKILYEKEAKNEPQQSEKRATYTTSNKAINPSNQL